MSNDPHNGPDDASGDDSNPFKGTPFEQFFSGGAGGLGGAMGGAGGFDLNALAGMFGGMGGPGGAGGQMPDLSALFGQLQSLMQPYDGPLNWDVALDIARKAVAASPDPTPTGRESDAIADAGSTPCQDTAADRAADPLDYEWAFEGPDRAQWKVGQTFIRCWAPD